MSPPRCTTHWASTPAPPSMTPREERTSCVTASRSANCYCGRSREHRRRRPLPPTPLSASGRGVPEGERGRVSAPRSSAWLPLSVSGRGLGGGVLSGRPELLLLRRLLLQRQQLHRAVLLFL